MKILANVLLTIGVCAAAVGAAGFHDPADTGRIPKSNDNPHAEPKAWPLFAGGMIVIAAGGVVLRMATRGPAGAVSEQHVSPTAAAIRETLYRIRDAVTTIDNAKQKLSRTEVCQEIDALLRGYYFDLVDQREDFLGMVGFSNYAKVWDGVANGERLLARVWSIATDGYLQEALTDLPVARGHIERAVEELDRLWPQAA